MMALRVFPRRFGGGMLAVEAVDHSVTLGRQLLHHIRRFV